MNIEIKLLSKDLTDDYIDFFDNVAFSDHKEWSYCYCAVPFFDKKAITQFIETGKENLREEARELISAGILQGYLAYENNKVIGFCNCGDKSNYKNLRDELWDIDDKNIRIKSIVCFIIASEMRGKGVATKLLDRVCSDADNEDFAFLEAYPIKNEGNNFQHFPGPVSLYEKKGFVKYREFEKDMVYRRKLR